MSARDRILGKLRAAQQSVPEVPAHDEARYMARPDDVSPDGLRARFAQEVRKLNCTPVECAQESDALAYVLETIGADQRILAWDFAHIPLPGLQTALEKAGITVAPPRDDKVRVGITGVSAALAATGGLVLTSGAGRPRSVSLLPAVHIAVIRAAQILPDFDAWIETQRAEGLQAFRRAANNFVITGSSRTADIAMETIMGVHGPGDVRVLILL
ncbi:MAG: lactate utilization protein [Chloroflexi bacterium]|nr:lactate utilization protein [Chloroflexota bacterium]